MSFNESVVNSKVLVNYFCEMSNEFLPPFKEGKMYMNLKKFETNNKILFFLNQVKKLIEEKRCDSETFKSGVIKLKNLNIELIWYLEIAKIITFKEYFEYLETNNDDNVKIRISWEIFKGIMESKNSKVKRSLMCDCLNSLLCNLSHVKESNETLVQLVFSLIFTNLICNSVDDLEIKCTDSFSILELLKESGLNETVIKSFGLLILESLLEANRDEPVISVFKKQERLKGSVKNSKTYKIFLDFSKYCDVNDFVNCFQNKFFNHLETLNWKVLMIFITFVGTHYNNGWSLLKVLCNDAIKESFQNFNVKLLMLGFIISRQSCFERPNNVFPSYLQWFSSTFSSESKRSINSVQRCNFFFNFLIDLLPYDPPYYSKVHINRTPWVPLDCQFILSDYMTMVKTHLTDLNVSSELGICENTTSKSAAVFDVENVLRHFEKTNEILNSVFQASMFWKEYYEKKFLVELLSKFEGKKSSRHKLITKLHAAGKIPNSMYKTYKSFEKK